MCKFRHSEDPNTSGNYSMFESFQTPVKPSPRKPQEKSNAVVCFENLSFRKLDVYTNLSVDNLLTGKLKITYIIPIIPIPIIPMVA